MLRSSPFHPNMNLSESSVEPFHKLRRTRLPHGVNLVPRVSHLIAWGERGDKMRDPGNEVGMESFNILETINTYQYIN